ncbi:MAG: aminotransferase class III-fold pyridoxal phosphate-dependent enzyme, partial [Candidatus Limiplasma sp.]|nr:aminotransferase class III-fold pyridoxal phosphate-dependent enzyme [Candidatus Limiplasma sp.]
MQNPATTALDAQYIAHTYARFPVTFVRGEGALLYDDAGSRYIDMGSGIAVSVLGYANPAWEQAVCAQAHALSHVSNLYFTQPQTQLAEHLCRQSGMRRAFFGNSGAEANECAIKTARKYSADRYGDLARPVIVTLHNSFHGRTLATLAATGQEV